MINNIVDVEQDEIDDKNVEFEEFEALIYFKNLHQKLATSKIFDWLNDEFDAMFYDIVLKAAEMKSWFVKCSMMNKMCSLKILEAIFLNSMMLTQCLSMRWKQQKKNLDLYAEKDSFYVEKDLFFWYFRCLIKCLNMMFCEDFSERWNFIWFRVFRRR